MSVWVCVRVVLKADCLATAYPCTDGPHWGHPKPGNKSQRNGNECKHTERNNTSFVYDVKIQKKKTKTKHHSVIWACVIQIQLISFDTSTFVLSVYHFEKLVVKYNQTDVNTYLKKKGIRGKNKQGAPFLMITHNIL